MAHEAKAASFDYFLDAANRINPSMPAQSNGTSPSPPLEPGVSTDGAPADARACGQDESPAGMEAPAFAASGVRAAAQRGSRANTEAPASNTHFAARNGARPQREKVGLSIDVDLQEAVRDYIHEERKRGNKLKINQVYEAALREYLSSHGNTC